jgi:hypothetical protein
MLNYSKAEKLALFYVDLISDGEGIVLLNVTITKPYGWIFFYQSKKFLETKDMRYMLLGNAPFLIDNINGELKVFGTAYSIEQYLKKYEKKLPKAVLQMHPEYPTNL